MQQRRDERGQKGQTHEGEEAAVDEKLGQEGRQQAHRRQHHQEEYPVLHKAHVREKAHRHAQQRAPGAALKHAHCRRHRRQHQRAHTEGADVAEHHVLRHERQEHQQHIAHYLVQIYFFEKITHVKRNALHVRAFPFYAGYL